MKEEEREEWGGEGIYGRDLEDSRLAHGSGRDWVDAGARGPVLNNSPSWLPYLEVAARPGCHIEADARVMTHALRSRRPNMAGVAVWLRRWPMADGSTTGPCNCVTPLSTEG